MDVGRLSTSLVTSARDLPSVPWERFFPWGGAVGVYGSDFRQAHRTAGSTPRGVVANFASLRIGISALRHARGLSDGPPWGVAAGGSDVQKFVRARGDTGG